MSFSIIRLIPGDPVLNIIGERGASPERIAEITKNLGLDKPLPIQFLKFSANALVGDFGESTVSKQPVISEFKVLWPATVELAFVALLWSSLVGLALGMLAAVKRNSFWDYGAVSLSTLGFAMPIFWWGLIVIFFFSVKLGIFPVSGRIDVMFDVPYKTGFYFLDTLLSGQWDAFVSACKYVILPAFVLGTVPLALIVRVSRASIIDVAEEDYVRTARSKGLPYKQILFKHIFKNALPQILTSIGLAMGQLLTGAILTETLFSWPGMGRWIIKSIEARDYPVVQAGVFYSMLIIIIVNWVTDESVKIVSPKMRDSQRGG
ncbi:dipeptide ABC transporter permease DppB [Bdellovibrio sp. qaytius]|nr:dipeptide ABC transporter permease DppB [Bdellovibrio sp. qaytius]